MQTADNVARWFLSRNELMVQSGGADYISNLKLQKLLYYAQGIFLGLYDKRLFAAPILAWHYGPVVEAIYQEYKMNKASGIEKFELPLENFTKEEEGTLSFVLENFGQFSAYKLMQMTHEERPWMETKQSQEIPVELIRDFFKENYVEQS